MNSWFENTNNDQLSQLMKKILRSTLRYKIQSKVSNSAPKSVSILGAAKAILFGSNALEHKW